MKNKQFQKIVEDYEKLVFTICYQFVHDYEEAQNLTQETFISAFTHIDRCSSDSYKPWLARIATNKAKDFLKSAYNRRVELMEEPQNVHETTPSPDMVYIEKESVNSVKNKILDLNEPYLKVSVMYFLEEHSVDEISTALRRPKKTVQTQLLRAKNILRLTLKEEGFKWQT